jgi:hypothetical protein
MSGRAVWIARRPDERATKPSENTMSNLEKLQKLADELFPLGCVTLDHPRLAEMVTDDHTVIYRHGEEVATCYRYDDAADTLQELNAAV